MVVHYLSSGELQKELGLQMKTPELTVTTAPQTPMMPLGSLTGEVFTHS